MTVEQKAEEYDKIQAGTIPIDIHDSPGSKPGVRRRTGFCGHCNKARVYTSDKYCVYCGYKTKWPAMGEHYEETT